MKRVNSALKTGETHNVEHQAPGSAQCVGATYTRLMWSTMQQGRLNALVLSHVHKVNVEHKAPGSAFCVGATSCTQR